MAALPQNLGMLSCWICDDCLREWQTMSLRRASGPNQSLFVIDKKLAAAVNAGDVHQAEELAQAFLDMERHAIQIALSFLSGADLATAKEASP